MQLRWFFQLRLPPVRFWILTLDDIAVLDGLLFCALVAMHVVYVLPPMRRTHADVVESE